MYTSLKSTYAAFLMALWAGLLLFTSFEVSAQTDTRFWFVAPEVSNDHGDRPIAFRITSEGQATQVRVYTPANTGIFDTTFLLPANNTTTIPLTHRISQIENDPPNTVHNRGFLIESTELITAYYEVITAGNNPDIFALKGRNALGTSFYLPGQNLIRNVHGHERIDIVATQVQVVPQPNAQLQSPATPVLCANDSLLLRANADTLASYQWLRNDSILPNATDSTLRIGRGGTYRVVLQYPSGCTDTSATQIITALPPLQPQIQTAVPPLACQGDTVLLGVNNAGNNR